MLVTSYARASPVVPFFRACRQGRQSAQGTALGEYTCCGRKGKGGPRKVPVSQSQTDDLPGHSRRLLVTESLLHREQQAVLSESGRCQRDGGIQPLDRQGRAPRRPLGELGFGGFGNSAPKPITIRFPLLRQGPPDLKNGSGALDTPGTFAVCFISPSSLWEGTAGTWFCRPRRVPARVAPRPFLSTPRESPTAWVMSPSPLDKRGN